MWLSLIHIFPDHSADFIVCSFGLKTFNETQLGTLADEVVRLLKPGGVFSFIEISVPQNALRPAYMFYLKKLIPLPVSYTHLDVYKRQHDRDDA